MQPYFFPYIGYYQLINAADEFYLYDDVQFIKGGWINRNRVVLNKQISFINLILSGASANKKINEIDVDANPIWKNKLIKSIQQSYAKTPNSESVMSLINEIIFYPEKNLAKYLANSIKKIVQYLEIKTHIIEDSSRFNNQDLQGKERVLDICLKCKTKKYINAAGGKELYDKNYFLQHNIELLFLETLQIEYKQNSREFIPNLSILDVLFYNTVPEIKIILEKYRLN